MRYVALADTDAALSRYVADIAAYNAEFERVWHRVMAAIDVETEPSAFGRLCFPAGSLCQSAGLSGATPCAPGAACVANVQTACDAGTFTLGGVTSCTRCPRGSFSSNPGVYLS